MSDRRDGNNRNVEVMVGVENSARHNSKQAALAFYPVQVQLVVKLGKRRGGSILIR